MTAFHTIPVPVQIAITFRAELEHFGWDTDHLFLGVGATLTNIPLEAAFVPPAGSILITVHLRIPDRAPDEFILIGGYLEGDADSAWMALRAGVAAWNGLTQDERNDVRLRWVLPGEAERLIRLMVHRGYVPPKLPELVAFVENVNVN